MKLPDNNIADLTQEIFEQVKRGLATQRMAEGNEEETTSADLAVTRMQDAHGLLLHYGTEHAEVDLSDVTSFGDAATLIFDALWALVSE